MTVRPRTTVALGQPGASDLAFGLEFHQGEVGVILLMLEAGRTEVHPTRRFNTWNSSGTCPRPWGGSEPPDHLVLSPIALSAAIMFGNWGFAGSSGASPSAASSA